MLSRHADSAYWIGRYIERAEATARMIDVHYHFGLESPLMGEALRWTSILAISGQDELFARTFRTGRRRVDSAVLRFRRSQPFFDSVLPRPGPRKQP